MKGHRTWLWVAGVAAWTIAWSARGGSVGSAVLLHWPVAVILLLGLEYDLKGGLSATAAAAVLLIALRFTGRGMEVPTEPAGSAGISWTLVAWQILVYGVFGLYPFKFIQVREQRQHHYRTLIEYKRGEMEAVRRKLAEVDRRCRELEQRTRQTGGAT